jgi:hypothetical protein
MSEQTSKIKLALDGSVDELTKLDDRYGSMGFGAHVLYEIARAGAWLCGIAEAVIVARYMDCVWGWIPVALPICSSALAGLAMERHGLLKLRASGYNAYHALLSSVQQEIPKESSDEGFSSIHAKMVKEMTRIAKEQEALHLDILAPTGKGK